MIATRTMRKSLQQLGGARVGTLPSAYESTTTNLWIYSQERRLASRVRARPLCISPPTHSRISPVGAKGSRRSKHRQDGDHFKKDEETGKMIIEESDTDVDGVPEPDVAGTAYREALTSVDGFTRGPGGRIKFNKDTKKRRRENAVEDEDVEMGEAEPTRPGKKRSDVKLGQEFRAKVRVFKNSAACF